jgi:hypothetical protein
MNVIALNLNVMSIKGYIYMTMPTNDNDIGQRRWIHK